MSPPDESSSDDTRDPTTASQDGSSGPDRSSNPNRSSTPDRSGPLGWWRWFRNTDDGTVVFIREMLESAAVVVAIGLILFAISGVWPPMVAVESGSMEPHMERGDLIFVMDEQRFPPGAAHDGTGVVTYQQGQQAGYNSFSQAGDVIIYKPYGSSLETPIIHRARFWVQEDENWVKTKANEQYLGAADSCAEVENCPAPHAGFITKGDNNSAYDQVSGISNPVKPEWIRGTAELKIPWLGHVRLIFSQAGVPTDVNYQPAPHAPGAPGTNHNVTAPSASAASA